MYEQEHQDILKFENGVVFRKSLWQIDGIECVIKYKIQILHIVQPEGGNWLTYSYFAGWDEVRRDTSDATLVRKWTDSAKVLPIPVHISPKNV